MQKEGGPRTSHDDGRLPEEIRFAKFSSISWTHDNKGFFYQARDAIQRRNALVLIFNFQRYPSRVSHGNASSDGAGTETTSDVDAELYYHTVGTPQCERFRFRDVTPGLNPCQAEDILVIKDPEHPDWMWTTSVSEVDGRYLELYITKDSSRVRMSSLQ